jgi:hypothetical protein
MDVKADETDLRQHMRRLSLAVRKGWTTTTSKRLIRCSTSFNSILSFIFTNASSAVAARLLLRAHLLISR